jgi:hypothetical protein
MLWVTVRCATASRIHGDVTLVKLSTVVTVRPTVPIVRFGTSPQNAGVNDGLEIVLPS